jgi:hypothetical protein
MRENPKTRQLYLSVVAGIMSGASRRAARALCSFACLHNRNCLFAVSLACLTLFFSSASLGNPSGAYEQQSVRPGSDRGMLAIYSASLQQPKRTQKRATRPADRHQPTQETKRGLTVYCRANRESLFWGLQVGALRQFGGVPACAFVCRVRPSAVCRRRRPLCCREVRLLEAGRKKGQGWGT